MPVDFVLKSGWALYASTEKAETFHVFAEGLDWTYYASSVRYESTRFSAATAVSNISTANPYLGGAGYSAQLLSGSNNGTIIQSVTIKARVSTTPGMIRLFIFNGDTLVLIIKEIQVPAVTKSGTTPAHSFSHTVTFGDKGFALMNGYTLNVSTEKGESFNVIAQGLTWTYPS